MATTKNRISIYLNDEMKQQVDEKAREYGVSTAGFVTFLVGQYMVSQKKMDPLYEMLATSLGKSVPDLMKKLIEEDKA